MPRLKDFKGAIRKMFACKTKANLTVFNQWTFFSVGSGFVVVFNNVGTDAYEGYRIAEQLSQ